MRKLRTFCSVIGVLLLIAIPAFAYADELRMTGGKAANNQVEATQDLVDFVYVDSMELSVGDTQYVAFSVKDDIAADKPVSLHYRNLIDGAEYVSTASNIVDGSALFELRFSTGASGTYQLTDVFYSTKTGSDYHMDLLALSETSTFIVAEEHSSQVRSLDASEEGSGIEVYGIDDDGDLVKSDGLFGTLSAKARASRANGRNLVVVIDPGHGGYDPGTVAGGLVESNLNLKIAQYCAQELRTY